MTDTSSITTASGKAIARPRMRMRPIKFRNELDRDFHRDIRQRVARYFDTNGFGKYANRMVVFKAALFLTLTVGAYTLILTSGMGPWALLGLANLFGASSLLLAINVAHDAAHHALTPFRRANRVIQTLAFTLLGANAYLWQLRHVKSHHNFPNVNGCDVDIDDTSFVRLSPNQPRRRYHRFQHLYAPFMFWLVDIHTVFFQDFVYLFKRRLANMQDIRHPKREYVLFFVCKLAYLSLMLFIPMALIDLPWWQIGLGWMIMSFIMSTIFISLLIGTHFAEETEFPEVDSDGYLATGWATHALVTSLDWAPESKIANFFVGGANAHAAHHLFPGVCHVHYPALTRIIRQAASEHGIKYNCTGFFGLLRSHFRFLKKMSAGEATRGMSAPGAAEYGYHPAHGA
jgi:linoleoyl-CoA desaturase